MRGSLFAACLTGALLAIDCPLAVRGEEPSVPGPRRVALPTLGGMQFWADRLFFGDWRIQRNAVTGRYRLLDGDNLRHASGTFADCRKALQRIKQEEQLPPMQGTGVLLLHGLGRTRGSMAPLADYIRRNSDFTVFNVSYASTRQSIEEHARSLAQIVENLDGIERIDFVGHSLGNIVVRRYLADQTDPAAGRRPDPRIRRMVMLGPPNHGSIAATGLGDNVIFQAITGETGQELGRQWVWLESSLATPQFEFGIIAGGRGNDRGINPLLPGDDDGVVTVQSTRLAGARDFLSVSALHSLLPANADVQKATLRFLKEGYFRAADRRQPVEEREERD